MGKDYTDWLDSERERLLKENKELERKYMDKRKQSLYFPGEMLAELQAEAERQDRSLSWLVQRAWSIARSRIRSIPAVDDFTDEELDQEDPPPRGVISYTYDE
jgi:uncharacterized small protein (TIGR04563 family)